MSSNTPTPTMSSTSSSLCAVMLSSYAGKAGPVGACKLGCSERGRREVEMELISEKDLRALLLLLLVLVLHGCGSSIVLPLSLSSRRVLLALDGKRE